MTETTILTITLVIASVVGVLNYLSNRGKTHVDIVATQNATIGTMSARLDTQGIRLDMQASKIDSLTAQLKASDENGASWQKLAEERLVKLDGMPVEIERLNVEIERLHNAAGIVAETNLASAHARETTAKNVATAQAGAVQAAPAPQPSEAASDTVSAALTGAQAEKLVEAGKNLIEAGKPPVDPLKDNPTL